MSEMARQVLDERGVKLLYAEVIALAVKDYCQLKKAGRIVNGKAKGVEIYKLGGATGNVGELCDFFWSGWMEWVLDQVGLKVQVSQIYKKLEPELWQNLIQKHRKG